MMMVVVKMLDHCTANPRVRAWDGMQMRANGAQTRKS